MSLNQLDIGDGTRLNAGNCKTARVVAGASTNATSVKASQGSIQAISVSNTAAYDVFLKLYDKASAPTVGTDTPMATLRIKTGSDRDISFADIGLRFNVGIAYAITKLIADSDTTAVVANDLTGVISYA